MTEEVAAGRRSGRLAAKPAAAAAPVPAAAKKKKTAAPKNKKGAAAAEDDDGAVAAADEPEAAAEAPAVAKKRGRPAGTSAAAGSKKKAKKEEADEDAAADEGEASNSSAKLKVGDAIPDTFKVHTHDGAEVSFKDLAKDHGIIVFTYPKANTPGCTKQAVGFKGSLSSIKDKDYEVYGLSADNVKPQKTWHDKYELGYTLLSDPEPHKLLKALGLRLGKSTVRSHVVIGKGGHILDLPGKQTPEGSVKNAVAFVSKGAKSWVSGKMKEFNTFE